MRRIGCVVLAAGSARRFGGGKLLAPFNGRPLLQHAIDAACGADALSCTLVLGAGGARIAAAIDARRCVIVANPRWQQGIATSIVCGIRAHRDDEACILMLGDQPNVAAADLDALIESFDDDPRRIVALRAGEVWGAPVLFPRRDFGRLLALRGDAGAKRHVASQRERVSFVDARRTDAFFDVDTREDLIRPSGS